MRKLILGIPAQVRGKSLTGLIIIFDAPIRPASITISYNLAARVALIMITSMTLRQLKLLLNPLRHSLALILRVFIHSVAYRGLKIITSLALRFQDFQRQNILVGYEIYTPKGILLQFQPYYYVPLPTPCQD